MPIYPLLSTIDQAKLPQLITSPTALSRQFLDSTHQVFVCDTVQGRMVLKVCDKHAVSQSGFWQGLNHLFDADFPNSLSNIKHTHDWLSEQGLYEVPEFVVSNHSFVLTRWIAGDNVDHTQVTDAMVVQLAKHISQLHQSKHTAWGNLHTPIYSADDWNSRLQATLIILASQSATAIPEKLLQQVLAQVTRVQETEFVPMLLDCRWDQFRKKDDGTLALIDLDAFVIGPLTLELVLFEYILTPAHFSLFKKTYSSVYDWPDDSLQKPCYQLLLFLMQVLGETHLESWMHQT